MVYGQKGEGEPSPARRHEPEGQNSQVGAEDAAHLGDVLVFTVEVLVPRFHAEFPLAGTDGGWACAVIAEGRSHREGLHSGFSPERSFTYAKGMGILLPTGKAPHCGLHGPLAPWPPRPAPCKTSLCGKFWQYSRQTAILRTWSGHAATAKQGTFDFSEVCQHSLFRVEFKLKSCYKQPRGK